MPTITVSRQDLYRLSGLPTSYSLAELDDALALVKGELGSRTYDGLTLRTAGAGWIESDQEFKLRIELKDTNRPDLWSVEGIARHLRDHRRGHGQSYDFFTDQPAELTLEVDPALESIRPFAGGFLADGGVVDEESLRALIETQETLTRNFGHKRSSFSMGVYDGDHIVFPVRFRAVGRQEVRFEPLPPSSSPLEWPPGAELTPQEILERHPTGQEYAGILAGHEHVPLLADATGAVLALIPVINSAGLGRVLPGMTRLFVDVTGTEQEHCLLALNILATNLADRGWSIHPVTTHYPYDTPRGRRVTVPHPMPITQTVPLGEFSRLLGEPLDAGDIVGKLTAYGVAAREDKAGIVATIPSYRQDYLHPVDVIEDYAISRGYDAIAATMAQEFTVGRLDPLTEFEDLVRDLLIGFGFEEAICNILTNGANLRQRMAVVTAGAPPFHGGPTVRIANVMSQSYSHLRDWIIPSLLEIEAQSAGALYPHRVFEVGEVAVFDLAANLGSRTESRLAAIIAADDASFDSVQSPLYALLGALGISFQVTHWPHPSFIEGRSALVTVEQPGEDAVPLGFLGELSPQVLTNWGARTPVAALELSLDRMRSVRNPTSGR
jgi:phenylalanyl-tRNA synthetase beta chain